MTMGMIWQDASKKALAEKVVAATAYYRKKYGVTANTVYINQRVFTYEAIERVGEVTVRGARFILPNDLWIGEE